MAPPSAGGLPAQTTAPRAVCYTMTITSRPGPRYNLYTEMLGQNAPHMQRDRTHVDTGAPDRTPPTQTSMTRVKRIRYYFYTLEHSMSVWFPQSHCLLPISSRDPRGEPL